MPLGGAEPNKGKSGGEVLCEDLDLFLFGYGATESCEPKKSYVPVADRANQPEPPDPIDALAQLVRAAEALSLNPLSSSGKRENVRCSLRPDARAAYCLAFQHPSARVVVVGPIQISGPGN